MHSQRSGKLQSCAVLAKGVSVSGASLSNESWVDSPRRILSVPTRGMGSLGIYAGAGGSDWILKALGGFLRVKGIQKARRILRGEWKF